MTTRLKMEEEEYSVAICRGKTDLWILSQNIEYGNYGWGGVIENLSEEPLYCPYVKIKEG